MSVVTMVRRHQVTENSMGRHQVTENSNCSCEALLSTTMKKIHSFSGFQALDEMEIKSIVNLMSLSVLDKVISPYTKITEDVFASLNLELKISEDTYLSGWGTAKQIFAKQYSGRMADPGDSDDSKQELPMFENKNKRKFLAEIALDPESDSSSSLSLTEFPRYGELEEKYKQAMSIIESMGEMVEQAKEEFDWSMFPEWRDPMVPRIEELLLKHLTETYRDAIKKIVEYGHSEENAERSVLWSGPYFGSKDLFSEIVDGGLDYLNRKKESDNSNCRIFEDLEKLVKYSVLEMVLVLKQVHPSLSIVDAMWGLLLLNMDLRCACAVGGNLRKFLLDVGESSSDSTSDQKVNLEAQKSELTVSDPNKSESESDLPVFGGEKNEKGSGGSVQVKGGRSVLDTKESIRSAVQAALMEGVDRKGSAHSLKKDFLRQKKFQFEKNYKGRSSKGSFKAKVTSLGGGPVLDKKPVPSSDGVSSKNSSMQSPEVNSKTQMANPHVEEKSTEKPKVNTPSPLKTAEYYFAGIPYDESQGKYVGQDAKDEAILALVSRMQALQKEVGSWNDWANEKVMDVALRLKMDQAELKTLRLEKEETEKYMKEKQVLEENTVKRLSEMENALTSAEGQVALADSSARRLVEENTALKEKMVEVNKKGIEETAKLEEAIMKEKEALKKCQLIGPEKALLQDELKALKSKEVALEKGLEKPKALINQFEAKRAQEEREKKMILKQIEIIKKEKERIEAEAKAEDKRIEENAEKELQKHKDKMSKLEETISSLKLDSEGLKIAELRKSASSHFQIPKQSTKRLPVFKNNFRSGPQPLKEEYECVMCLSKEKSVIFLPCAHQVLCVDCNVVHEKKGIKDCPSCRAHIQMRLEARLNKRAE